MLTFDMIRRIYGERAPVQRRVFTEKPITATTGSVSITNNDEHHFIDEVYKKTETIYEGTTEEYPLVLESEGSGITEHPMAYEDDDIGITEVYPIMYEYEDDDIGVTEHPMSYEEYGLTGLYPMVLEDEESSTTKVHLLHDTLKRRKVHKIFDDYSPAFETVSDSYDQNVGVNIIQCIAAVVSLTALVYGIITWATLPKSRTFNNYVYINSIFTLTLVLWLPYLAAAKSMDQIVMYSVLFFEFGFLCWLAIASVLMYRDIVLVFATEIKRKTLKCNLFAWGVPLVGLTVLLSTGNLYFYECYSLILWAVFVVQVFFYLRVLYCLFSVSQENKPSVSTCRNIQIATFTFFMGGIPVVLEIAITQRPMAIALDVLSPMNLVIEIFLLFPMIVYNVFFVIRKSNRCLWREWREKRKAANLNKV